jgi:hypothetical protein
MNDIFYRKEGDEYILVHQNDMFGHDDEMWRGPEVAIGFTYDPDSPDRGIQYTTHRHGSPETVAAWAAKTAAALKVVDDKGAPLGAWAQPYVFTSAQWDLEDLNRIIDTTGYLAVVVDKLGIAPEFECMPDSSRYSVSSVQEDPGDQVDHRGFNRVLGNIDQHPELAAIIGAITSRARRFSLPNGERMKTRTFGEGNLFGVDHAGRRYIEQNRGTESPEALRAKNGAQIVWVLQTHDDDSGLPLPKNLWIGQVEDGVVRMR